MPNQIKVNNKIIDVFSPEECETDPWINGDIPMFTGKDIVEVVSMSRGESFSSTSEYYYQLSGYIRAICDENDRSEAWFLNEENINNIIFYLEFIIQENKYEENQEFFEKLKSLLKTINNGMVNR